MGVDPVYRGGMKYRNGINESNLKQENSCLSVAFLEWIEGKQQLLKRYYSVCLRPGHSDKTGKLNLQKRIGSIICCEESS